MTVEIDAVTVGALFRALSDATRLKMVGILAARYLLKDRYRWASADELATLAEVSAATATHHLNLLGRQGLVSKRKEGTRRLFRLEPAALDRASRLLSVRSLAGFATDISAEELDAQLQSAGQRFADKVFDAFVEGETLKQIPAGPKKRLVLLRWLAAEFSPGMWYSEIQVNQVLRRHHQDVAYLRRELVEPRYGLMRRQRGMYLRLPE